MRVVCALFLSVSLAGCGAVGQLASAISAEVDEDVRVDLVERPYMACAFEAPREDIVRAMAEEFEARGYEVGQVASPRVYAKPIKVEEFERDDYAFPLYRMEELSGLAYDMDGTQVAYLEYVIGVSTSDSHYVRYDGAPRGPSEETRWVKEASYFGDLMAGIAGRLGQPACGQ